MNDADRMLLDRWLDGDADAASVSALLERNPEAAIWLASRAALHADLRRALERRRLQRVALDVAHPRQGRWSGRWAWAAAAVLAVSAAVLALWPHGRSGHPQGTKVEVVAANHAGGEWLPGAVRELGHFALHSGQITLRLENGVLLDVSAPANLEIESAMSVRLISGKVTADVGARGKGFTIATPQTRVVDLGTVFGVEAADGGHTDVVVFSGAVELHEDAPVETLTRGQAVRVSKADGRRRIQNVVTSRRRAEWSTSAPPEGCAFRSVTDDAERAEEPFSYQITQGGLAEGAEAFVELPFVLREVPLSLAGADLVRTFRGARKSRHFQLEVALARPAVLHVLFEASSPPPAWLTEQFRRTGNTLRLASPDPAVRRTVVLAVWDRVMPQGGSITLGPARDGPEPPPIMYVLAATPLP
ncbi:MAG: FecR domain-containing protein [Verrucomicrobiales bacterium]|nr:FecR domain-containing protein [Verrucomicrobiales bacterium]